jgi:aminopeptidase N
LAVLLWCASSLPARAAAPFSFEAAPGRLPKDVVPEDYDLAIVPDAKTLRLAGTESVSLDFRKATDRIQFNSLNERLSGATLDGQPVKDVVSDDQAQLTTVTLNQPAAAGRHRLRFTHTGVIETKPQGLFAQPFVKPVGGNRTITPSQQRFLLQGADSANLHWSIPLQVRSGPDAVPQSVLLTKDGQTVR